MGRGRHQGSRRDGLQRLFARRQALCDFAGRLRSHVVGSHVERDGEDLHHCVVLIAPDVRGAVDDDAVEDGTPTDAPGDWAPALAPRDVVVRRRRRDRLSGAVDRI